MPRELKSPLMKIYKTTCNNNQQKHTERIRHRGSKRKLYCIICGCL
jgi:hypothetical protein